MAPGQGVGQGKVILLGEHAVVYGEPALAAALEVGVRALATAGGGPRVRVEPWGVDLRLPGQSNDLERAMTLLLGAAPAAARRAELRVEAEIPSSAGLGSSAAMAVAVTRALGHLAGGRPSVAEVEAVVARTEAIFHGRPSGVDAAVACRGGTLRFQRGRPPEPVAAPPLPAVVALVEPRATTSSMVQRVAQRREAAPAETDLLLADIGRLVDEGTNALVERQWSLLGQLMDRNHLLLGRLGLVTPGLEVACQRARAAGALGAKMTGAGGGGCVVALVAQGQQQQVARALAGQAQWVCPTWLGRLPQGES